MMRELANGQKKQDHIENENKTHSVVSVWIWWERCFNIPYNFTKHKTWSSFIVNFCKQIWGVERVAL